MDARYEALGFAPADVLIPRGIDLTKWAVVACDQFTSQPEYWEAVEETVGDAPSSLRLILPEAGLSAPDVEDRIAVIDRTMDEYLGAGIFRELPETLVYVERVQSDGAVRHGLVGMVDLERYDFTPGSGSLIRATEGTVLSRIPPRAKVRAGAAIELPHVMLLIDDPEDAVIGPLHGAPGMDRLYAFPLQQGGGSIRGWAVTEAQTEAVADALSALCAPEIQERRYGIRGTSPLLFAVGDGNHSLATAKQCYEDQKRTVPEDQRASLPSRWALVEVVNVHDEALRFEPIHRVLSDVDPEAVLDALLSAFPGAHEGPGEGHEIGIVWAGEERTVTVPHPAAQLAVGTLQGFLDAYLAERGGEIDYIHGEETVRRLAARPGSMGFLLPPMGKEDLFRTVVRDGVLPRKTFSMGHAQDKRYYVEARRIR